MQKSKRVLAFDFGASSGRAIIGEYDGEKISLKEVHRFSNDPVSFGGVLYWDVLRLLHEIKQGIIKGREAGGFDSIGIDTWGVDFGLLDKDGHLLENPVHYRDARTSGILEEAFKLMPRERIYEITGIQFMELNTLFQLLAIKQKRPELLERADKLLFMPDLLTYMLTGEKTTEYSIATTSQIIDLKTRNWSGEIIENFGLPSHIFCPPVPSGRVAGRLDKALCEELSAEPVPVISVCGHDTQSALTAVPSEEKDFAFISSGTWSLFGTELDEPIVNEKAVKMNVTNEGGYGDSVGFLKNITGLWLIQESRRYWNRRGNDYSYADLENLALKEEPFKCFINPDSPEFGLPGNIPKRIKEYCEKTGQYVPKSVGEIVRCIYESLAMKYRLTFEKLQDCTGVDYDKIHVIGGGVKDTLLCQMTANACKVKVLAGPIEATVLGNIVVQLLAGGDIENISQARAIIAKSEKVTPYLPKDTKIWDETFKRAKEIVN
ncbi:MAG: rhamnulokinase [Clostridiales bacterium]|nr:rhamnulokinase [Clostridiales bacterium]